MYHDTEKCAAVGDLCYYAKGLFVEYRLTFLMLGSTFLNLLKHHMRETYVPSHFAAAYPHLSESAKYDVTHRCMKLWFGSAIAATGYLFLFYHAWSTCNASEIYIFLFGGMWTLIYDMHEYLGNWPTPGKVAAHHLTVLLMALSLFDWQIFGASFDPLNHWAAVLLVSNMGTAWIADYFHVVYRTSQDLSRIQQWKLVAVVLSATSRVINAGLLVALTQYSAQNKASLGTALLVCLDIVHVYNTWQEVSFVWQFDCHQYFLNHQAHWQRENGFAKST